jgi:hypothetical protein
MDQDVTVNSSYGGVSEAHAEIIAQMTASRNAESSGGAATTTYGRTVRDLYIKPVLRQHVEYSVPPGWIRWMSWNTIRVGDCTMEGAKLYVYPDGMVFFQASTSSSSSGDVWLIREIQFLDQFNHPVGRPLPQHNGMNMAWEGSEYPLVFWDAIPGVTASGAAQIRSASMTNHC